VENYLQYNRGSNTITVPLNSIQQNDFLEIQIKDGSWHGNYHPDNTHPIQDNYVGQIVEVESIVSSTANETVVTLKDKLRLNYGWENGLNSGNLEPKVQKLTTVNNIGFENFKIINEGATGGEEGYNFRFDYAVNCWIWGVHSEKPYRAHVNISRSSGIEIRGCYFHDAKEFGGGGEGYGITINTHSTNCLIEDNVFDYLRHAMMVQGGANGNVFGYNFSGTQPTAGLMDGDIDNGDISFHGTYPYENLFEGNMALFADADRFWGSNGPYNVLFRNQLRRTPDNICFNLYSTTWYPANNGGIRIIGPYVGGVWQPQVFYVFGNTIQYAFCGETFKNVDALYFTTNEAPQNSNNVRIGSEGGEAGYSMYYTAKPSFLTASYTWPPVGCKRGGASLTQSIPARDRYYNETIKTVSSPAYSGEQSAAVLLEIEQRRESTALMTGTTVSRWENAAFQNYTVQLPLPSFLLPSGSFQTFRGQQTVVNGPDEKYNQWKVDGSVDNDVKNHHTFTIQSTNGKFTSQFKTIHNATIQAQLVEGGNPSGAVEFKDPWLIDYPDPNYGNNLRNQGMSAPFKSVPYAQNNIGINTAYKGVFLNENPNFLPDRPNYSVGAPSPQVIGGYESYFSHWSGSNVTFQNANAQQTGVVFTNSGATAIANYKGHLITNSVNALASNSQRKVIQDEYTYHLVYESGGNIYHTLSADGQTWEPEVRVNPTIGNCFSPSITFNTSRNQHLIAYLQDVNGERTINVAASDDYGYSWYMITSFAAPTAQQLQISSMTAPTGSPDLLVWREGTSMLKGALRRYSMLGFGTARNLRLKDYNTITGFSLGAFGRTDRWDMVWTENNNLYYSSIYDDATTAQPWMDFGAFPAVVAAGDDFVQHANPSLVKTGSSLTVAWEAYDVEVNDRNIKVVTITPNLPGYPTIGTATVFTDNQQWASRYYTPSISSHYNNNLSLSWKATGIYSTKRVNGSWQSVTSLGSGVDPSASERIVNTQSASLHFRRGTTLPYVLAQSTLSTGGGMEKSGGQQATFAGEGREIRFSSPQGTSSFLLLNATSGGAPVRFSALDESQSVSSLQQLRVALQSAPFIPSGEVTMELYYNSRGERAPLRKVRVLLEEVTPNGSLVRTLGIAKEYEGEKKEKESLTFALPKTTNPVRLIIDPVLRGDSLRVELSHWYVVNAAEESFEKTGEERKPARVLAPAVLQLFQNYPNPFNPTTTIEFTVPKDGHATVTVYNSLGQQVATLFDGVAQAGYVQQAIFDGKGLSSGVYFSRLEFDGKTLMKKLMLVK